MQMPPSDITPADFFENWLPGQYQTVRAGLAQAPPDAVIGVALSGEGGGDWTLTLASGDLSVAASASDAAQIAIKQSVPDWRLVTTQAASEGADPAAMASIDKLLAHPALGQLLTVRGSIGLRILGLQGRDFAVDITFGGIAEPACVISVDADTIEQIRSGALPAPQAFFSGKLTMDGDPSLAMQIGMAFMS